MTDVNTETVDKNSILSYMDRWLKFAEARSVFNKAAAVKRGMATDTAAGLDKSAADAKMEVVAIQKAIEIVKNSKDA